MKDIQFPNRIFVTGIDTDAGKSYATGWLARGMMDAGLSVITQKFVQTGNTGFSEDIDIHRAIMGCGYLKEDMNHLTAPEIFSYPCSPDLAAKIDGREIDFEKIADASSKLNAKYDYLILEGAGGLMVPLKGEYLTLNYVIDNNLPVVVVTNGRLGSINHTLLLLQCLIDRNIPIFALIYNSHFDKDAVIVEDTKRYIRNWLSNHSPQTHFFEMPSIRLDSTNTSNQDSHT